MPVAPRVVWILGAGFSVPLGGSTLNDLLSLKNFRILQARFPELVFEGSDPKFRKYKPAVLAVYALYHYGRQFPEGPVLGPGPHPSQGGERIWDNAEDFLDYLDVACSPKREHAASHLESVLGACRQFMRDEALPLLRGKTLPTLGEMRCMARRLVAAECCLIEQPEINRTERWNPYHRWSLLAREHKDTIVTFNYDRVLELLRLRGSVVHFGQKQNSPRSVLKLHGSVDWKLREVEFPIDGGMTLPEGYRFVRGEPTEALTCKDSQLCMATPGPTKLSETSDVLRPLWDMAGERLRDADVILFVGYRFPPSDARAREFLVEALVENKRRQIDVHIVLGPQRSDDVVRLEHLLRHVLESQGRANMQDPGAVSSLARRYTLTWHPLWAQDFLAIYDRDSLLYPRGRLFDV